MPKRALIERKSVWEPLLLETTKWLSSPTLGVKVFPYPSFMGLQCFLPSSVLWAWGTHSGLSYNKGKLFSLVEGWGDKLEVSGVTTQIAVSHGNNIVVGH